MAPRRPVYDRHHPLRRNAEVDEIPEDPDQRVGALDPGDAYGEYDVRLGHGGPSQGVALLHVDRSRLRLPLQLGVGVAHQQRPCASDAVEGGLDRSRSQRNPAPGPPQTEEKVVAPLLDGEHERAQIVRGWRGGAVGLHQLLHAGHDVARVVQHGLVGMKREVGEQDPVGAAPRRRRDGARLAMGQALRQGDGERRGAGPARTADHSHPAPGGQAVGSGGRPREMVGPPDHGCPSAQGIQQLLWREPLREGGHGSQPQPIAAESAVLDHDDDAASCAGQVDQVSVQGGNSGVDDGGRARSSRREAGLQVLPRQALHQLDGYGAGGRPVRHRSQPLRPGPREGQDHVAPARHRAPLTDSGSGIRPRRRDEGRQSRVPASPDRRRRRGRRPERRTTW